MINTWFKRSMVGRFDTEMNRMHILNVLVWNDATLANNDVECVVTIDMNDVATLVARELEKRTGKKFVHWEVRGITSDPIDFDLPVVNMEVE